MTAEAVLDRRLLAGPQVNERLIEPVMLGRERRRVSLAGVWIDQITFAAAVDLIPHFLSTGHAHQIATVNLDFLRIAQRDPVFRETINSADLAVPDGMPLVWLSKLRGQPLAERITGVELVDQCCQIAAERRLGVFLLGATPEVAAAAGRTLEVRYPGLRVVGVHSPPFGRPTPEQDAAIVRLIRDAAPSFLFVALGAPRQDLWIAAHREALGVPVAMGIGCVFDLLAGAVRRAPEWMQHGGLEWAFRLGQEPGRLWRRYLMGDLPLFTRLLATSLFERSEVDAQPRVALRYTPVPVPVPLEGAS
jgi:N-acetylglucosaminyldiphosphoundecaprenol N-acetyl-beta-D-mannosaminyltransferase